jgi:uncharacterized membrane protein
MVVIAILWQLLPSNSGSIQTHNKALPIIATISIVAAAISAIIGLFYQPEFLIKMGGIIDIAANTYAATDAFAQGLNPYTTKAQLWVNTFPADTPHIEVINDQITMYNIPYFHGYPYFPLMMLSYLPAYWLVDGYTAIRLTHIVLLALNVFAMKLLCDKCLPTKEQRNAALLIAITAYFGLLRYTLEAVLLGVTDILISTYILYCFVALSYQRYFLAGLLLGCAQACKLLPAPFIFIAISWMLYGSRHLWHFFAGFILSCTIIILPFIIWHPEGFLSSTILYYLTHHKSGDLTSLWYFLPSILQAPFLLLGILLTLTSIFAFMHRGNKQLIACITASFVSYVIFMAFSKMSHLNYLWGVLPLGCIALSFTIVQYPHKAQD